MPVPSMQQIRADVEEFLASQPPARTSYQLTSSPRWLHDGTIRKPARGFKDACNYC
ncbi:MAG: hypothetical protein HY673_12365 [Chloroflexi bacterium]|nr:hypothetical protein [Chloroflexota bacterium]